MKQVGYQARDSVSHRTYDRKASIRRFLKSGRFTYRGTKIGKRTIYGLGHKAGENWGDKKNIDPESKETKYSKNSPSFDEGVYLSKKKRAIADKM